MRNRVSTYLLVVSMAMPAVNASQSRAADPHAELCAPSMPFVFEGVVLAPSGAPSSGAIVVSSAGGQAVTQSNGAYRLEVAVPIDARRVELTAVAKGNERLMIRANVDVDALSGVALVDPLVLAAASCQLGWEPTFGQAAGVSGPVCAMTVFDDGSGPALYVGGAIYSAGSSLASRVAKWDGTQWSAVGRWSYSDIGFVLALAVFDDGSGPALYAAGGYDEELGGSGPRVLKFNGTTWSAVGSGTPGQDDVVRALAVYDEGSGPALYAGGEFFDASYNFTHGIQKWDGTSWSMLGSGVNSSVHALCVFNDGGGHELYVGGWFTSAGGTAASHIAKWDGSTWSALGRGVSGQNALVTALAVFDDGSGSALYAGGSFASAGGVTVNHIAKWNGASWSALSGGMNTGGVAALATFDDGTGTALYAGGLFMSTGGVSASHIAKWDGAVWSALGSGMDYTVRALAVFDDGSGAALSAGGEFFVADGVGVNSVANWDGSKWSPLGDGLNNQVLASAVFDDGGGPALYAAGRLKIDAGGVIANGIARWNGTGWSALGSGLDAYEVDALAVFDDGTGPALYAGGYISGAGGMTVSNIAKWNGSTWSAVGSGVAGSVWTFTVFDDGTGPALYVGGNFPSAGGVGAKSVAKWNGTIWKPVGGGTPGQVYALCVFDDGSGPALYAGGNTWFQGPGLPHYIAKWTGTTWVAVGGAVNLDVYALTVFDDGGGPALYAAGAFTSPANHIAKWDGTSWSALGTGTNGTTVDALAVFDDGSGRALYAGGAFTLAGGSAANRIARWDGASWSPLGSGMNGRVRALASFDDGSGSKLYAGGTFTSAFDSGDGFFARWGCWLDTTAPVLSCPGSVLAFDELEGPPGTIVNFTVTANDDYDLSPSVVSVPPSGSYFPRGATVVNCTATDDAGNQSTCQFTVTVTPKLRSSGSTK